MIDHDTKYVLRDGCLAQLFENMLEISAGIWNYNTLSLHFEEEWQPIIQAFVSKALDSGISISDLRSEFALDAEAIGKLEELFLELHSEGLLISLESSRSRAFSVLSLLGLGEEEIQIMLGDKIGKIPSVGIITNNEDISRLVGLLGYEQYMKMKMWQTEDLGDLLTKDLTFRIAAMETLKEIEVQAERFQEFDVVTVLTTHPNPFFLRNINRLMAHLKKPWILGTLDGPFVLLATFVPFQTSCYECFEIRVMTRMHYLNEYKEFVKKFQKVRPLERKVGSIPMMHLLTALTLNESLLMGNSGYGHFVGRLLSIYLPLFEMQVQDVLRFPTCPACGHAAKTRMKELYFDMRKVVSDLARELDAD